MGGDVGGEAQMRGVGMKMRSGVRTPEAAGLSDRSHFLVWEAGEWAESSVSLSLPSLSNSSLAVSVTEIIGAS